MELLINDKNKTQFKESLLSSLNCDISEIDNKVNKELLDRYLNDITKKESINNLDPLIIKISKFKSLYDKYLEKILNTSYNEYFIKTKVYLNDNKNLDNIIKYSLEYIDYLDLNNEIEYEISKIFSRYILKHKLNKYIYQKWYIKYIIKKELIKYNISPDIKVTSPINYKLKLNKISTYNKIDSMNNNIIDLRSFNALKLGNYNKALVFILNNSFKYLQGLIFDNIDINNKYNKDLYIFMKETIIYQNIDNNLIINPLYENIKKLNIINEDYPKIDIDLKIDELVLKDNTLLTKYPLLKCEYSDNGIKKTLRELINSYISKKEDILLKEKEYNKILKESDNDIVINKISSDLKELLINKDNITTFHNELIYSSLELLSILDLTKLLPKLNIKEIEVLKKSAISNKNIVIKKLEVNRKKIFKPDTFFKNEEILTKEYSKAARYESKINDYLKESQL